MKVVVFLVCMVLFVGSFFLFGYAFEAPTGANYLLFGSGLAAIALSLAIPFHLLEKFD